MSNSLSGTISSNYLFIYGIGDVTPVTGDWNGDGRDSVGWFRDSDSSWHLTNDVAGTPNSDYLTVFGVVGCKPVTGDWDGNNTCTIGWYRESDNSWHLSNTIAGPVSNYLFVLGAVGAIPVVWQ